MSIDPLTQERDFFLERSLRGDWTWVGLSSDAMLRQALTGAARPDQYPRDQGDLSRCEKTYERAPVHLQLRMLPTLELFRRMVNPDTGVVDGLWCYECDHGGHSCTWHDMCKEHAEQAGIDTRSIWEREKEPCRCDERAEKPYRLRDGFRHCPRCNGRLERAA